eukprot:TCALIF_07003-PB protein Name:"Protein of unknown function" AED:0.35 eAED:0.35 QI:0/0.75/0.6/1/0.75/0.6/5/124/426
MILNKTGERDPKTGVMRKYYKLALFLVAAFSFVCFLFYKTQYDKLYNVLEVLEFFGNGKTAGLGGCSTLITRPPAFQRLSDDIYTYSAFCERSLASNFPDDCSIVTTAAIVKGSQDLTQIRCRLWYAGSTLPIDGVFAAAPVSGITRSNNGITPYQFSCESKYSAKIPYGVTFRTQDNQYESFVHIADSLPSNTSPQPDSVAICLLPPQTPEDTTYKALEHVLLNTLFGVNNFLVYDYSLTRNFFRALSLTRDLQPNIYLLPWNPPTHLTAIQTESLIQTDCLLRTKRLFETVMVLNNTQILVPRDHGATIQATLKETNLKGHLKVTVRHFCSEMAPEASSDSNIYSLTSLEQASFDPNARHKVGVESKVDFKSELVTVSEEFLVLHDYGACGKYEFETSAKDTFLLEQRQRIENKVGRFFPKKTV